MQKQQRDSAQSSSRPAKRPASKRTQGLGAGSRSLLAALSVTALMGGWNLIGRLDAAQAKSNPAPEENPLNSIQAPAENTRHLPEIPSLHLAPIPTLRPAESVAPVPAMGVQASAVQVEPALPALAPLPTMAPLPALPSMPAPPSNNGGGSSGGSSRSSGGS